MHPTPTRPRLHALRTGRSRTVLVAGIIAALAAVATGCGSAGAGEAGASPDLDAREAELNDREAELEQVEAARRAQETEEAEQRADEAEARADEAEQRAEEAEESQAADRATTTTTPPPPAAPVEVEVNVDAGPGDVVVAPAPAPVDSDLIPAGVIEDGMHYGYVTDIEGWEFTFDRADVAADGSWTNGNSKLRTLPMSIGMWQGGALVGGSPIEIEVRNQRVVWASVLTDSCGC